MVGENQLLGVWWVRGGGRYKSWTGFVVVENQLFGVWWVRGGGR